MKIKLAFKKKTTNNILDKIVAYLIKWKTNSKYFHIEMAVKDKWISTNPDDGAVYIKNLLPLSNDYDYIDIDISEDNVKKMIHFAKLQVGKKYDWFGIFFSQAIDFNLDNKNKWFCSEMVAEMLKIAGETKITKTPNQYSPGDIYNLYKS